MFEVGRQPSSVANAGWSNAKAGDAGQGEDGGAFSALLNGLADEPASPHPLSQRRGEGRAGDDASDKTDASSSRGSDRLSALLDGEQTVRGDGAKGGKEKSDATALHLELEKMAARQEALRGQEGKALPQPEIAGGETTKDDVSEAGDGMKRPARARRPDGAETAAAPNLHAAAADGAATPMPVAPQNPASGEVELVEGEAGQGAGARQAQPSDVANGDDAASGDRIQVKVLNRETHFAPTAQANASGNGRTAEPFTLPEPAERASASLNAEPAAGKEAQPAGERRAEAKSAVMPDGSVSAPVHKDSHGAQSDERRQSGERRSDAKAEAVRDTSRSAGEAASLQSDGERPASGPVPSGTQGWTLAAQQGLPLSNLRQVSQAIGAELAQLGSAASQTPAGTPQGQGPVRLLDIQLHPDTLGTVTVRMRSSAAGLEVKLHASNPQTAKLLKEDQAKLSELLRAEGLEAANVSVVDGADAGGAWTRFEMPRQVLASASLTPQADDQGSFDQRQEGGSSRDGQNEDETPSGRRDRSDADRG